MSICIALMASSFMVNAEPPEKYKEMQKIYMNKKVTEKLIHDFYDYFNRGEFDKIDALIANDFEHEINYDGIEKGKAAVMAYMKTSAQHYKEIIENYTLMMSEDGSSATTKFIVKGKYIATDASKIPAKGQEYQLEVYNYFEVKNGLFVKGRAFFNEKDFKEQVSKG
jgi:steroid delta-isomerase-like uncharacterized protein